ncbi:MAG: hypothetical protein J3R72DRAFT_2558 [Linnemannia gamsii]|nr:MAG: hypothetical protein J3R72DRAFT_2558 [Linnemannia gamsii]
MFVVLLLLAHIYPFLFNFPFILSITSIPFFNTYRMTMSYAPSDKTDRPLIFGAGLTRLFFWAFLSKKQ